MKFTPEDKLCETGIKFREELKQTSGWTIGDKVTVALFWGYIIYYIVFAPLEII